MNCLARTNKAVALASIGMLLSAPWGARALAAVPPQAPPDRSRAETVKYVEIYAPPEPLYVWDVAEATSTLCTDAFGTDEPWETLGMHAVATADGVEAVRLIRLGDGEVLGEGFFDLLASYRDTAIEGIIRDRLAAEQVEGVTWRFFIQGGELVTDRGRFPVVVLRQDITVEGGASFMVSPINPVMRGPSPGVAQDAVSQYEQSASGQMRDPGGRLLKPASEQTTEECVQQAHSMFENCMKGAASKRRGCELQMTAGSISMAVGCAFAVWSFPPALLGCAGLFAFSFVSGVNLCQRQEQAEQSACYNDYLRDLLACGVVIVDR
ncbi:MAG: hypothetical protein KF787_13490 [Phycisphaeraceae bacterium]|nr:hypothetical protein [Phycisphaerae bacterium]MBX3393648.1 hypothetical protein [Phycisphaeraceae bacterium]